jgi:ubiquinone/menaquinone biosynthesis C-methylase UbiE
MELQAEGYSAFGVDESRQMARQALHRSQKKGGHPGLTRGYAQHLPFRDQVFDCVVSTFPSEFIFEPQTLLDIRRVLEPEGRLVIIPMAWISGENPLERFMSWLLRSAGDLLGKPGKVPPAMKERLNRASFLVESELVELKGSKVLVVVGTKRV